MVALHARLIMITRRQFMLKTAAAGGLALAGCVREERPIAGRIVGAPAALGHRLLGNEWPAIASERTTDVVVVGGGIAGLSAARQLSKLGARDLLVLEGADNPGGNSAFGVNSISDYPWGAHYVPLVRNDDDRLLKLFQEMQIVTGFQNDLPVYNEYFLSSDPQERLLIRGRWQEGLVPAIGVTTDDREQYRRFFALIAELKDARGKDGNPLFSIPVERSSTDPDWRKLDGISFADYLLGRQFTSRPLYWYVNYCCRDDYGATADRVSAWAGLHYFAARTGRAANADTATVVTWPEGNGFFTRAWSGELGTRIECNSLAFSVATTSSANKAGGVSVDYFDVKSERSVRVNARAAVLAVPQNVLRRLLPNRQFASIEYSPWVVANLSLNRRPQGRGMELAWDNVVYDSPMLGYVVADHQRASRPKPQTVITYYWPLTHLEPPAARRETLSRTHYDWQSLITTDLYRVHPELRGHIDNIDIMIWGHGMARPVPGALWGRARETNLEKPLFAAHSDQSGISIFEEAFHRGTDAAERCHDYLDKRSS